MVVYFYQVVKQLLIQKLPSINQNTLFLVIQKNFLLKTFYSNNLKYGLKKYYQNRKKEEIIRVVERFLILLKNPFLCIKSSEISC